jgi:hypothetical protein
MIRLRKAMPIKCTGIDMTMFTCRQFKRVEPATMKMAHQSLVNTSREKWCVMASLQMAMPVAVAVLDTQEAQEARWIAWTSKGAAADRIMQRRMRIIFTAILIALACVTLAAML